MLVLPGETPVSKEIDHSEVHRMGRILEELYIGDLQPAENRNWDDPEYEVKCEASLEEVHAFCERLDEESREAFDTMMENYLELCHMEKTQAFSDGFRIGARMMWEVFGREATGQSAR